MQSSVLTCPLLSLFLDTYSPYISSFGCKGLCIVTNFLITWSICLSSSIVHFKNGPEYPWGRPGVYPLDSIFAEELGFEKLSRSFEVLFSNFFLSSLLIWWCQHPIFLSICSFPFLQTFWFFPDLLVLFLLLFVFSHFSLWTWSFFYAKFYSYILALYSYCLYQSIQFFFIFCKHLDVVHVHVINLFLQLCKFIAPSTFPKYEIEWHHCYYR